MTGNDVTAEELAQADEFLRITQPHMPESFMCRRIDMVRCLAWFGAIRADRAEPKPLVDLGDVKE